MRNVYQGVKAERKRTRQQPVYCRNKQGELIGGIQECVIRSEHYFPDLLKNVKVDGNMDELGCIQNDKIAVEPTEKEVRGTIQQLKYNKSAGENVIIHELIMERGRKLEQVIHNLLL